VLVPGMARAADVPASTWKVPDDVFVYAVIIIVFLAIFIAFALVFQRLSAAASWSLADALSEEADVTVDDVTDKPYTVNGTVVKKTELAASTSRLIAFIGTIAILFLFLGFGAIIMWEYAETGTIQNADAIGKYLLAGLTLFAPYVVNKFASVFAPK
jgi:hypothetical protein